MRNKPQFMLIERGRFYYLRRVPTELVDVVGKAKWREALGSDFDDAYMRLRELKAEHDALIKGLSDPEEARDHKTAVRRAATARRIERDRASDAKWRAMGFTTDEDDYLEAHGAWPELPDPWEGAEWLMDAVEEARQRTGTDRMDDDEAFDFLTNGMARYYGPHATRPDDPNDRDRFDLMKSQLERRIARYARNPDTLKRIADKFIAFAELKPKTEDKYRRTLARFVAEIGNIPIGQVSHKMLRDYRDALKSRGLVAASIHAEFTPISGLLSYAVDEQIIELDPMAGVKLPKEKRAVEETKWLPFDQDEVKRIFAAMETIWGQPVQGLTAARRDALSMAVRVLAYTAMRPAELLSLRPDQVDARRIQIEGGKTKSAWRVIPLHPEIADFPAWLHKGGMAVFNNTETGKSQTDPATSLRHNFARLIRDKMEPHIRDDRKVLYSWRSTFQNAMRRAGAPKDVRRAILGHVESGAIRHYDDGAEFELLKEWIEKTDPRR